MPFRELGSAEHCVLVQADPFKTLFVARLSFDVTERKLAREFEEFGPLKNIRLVHDKNSGERSLSSVSNMLCRRPVELY